MSSRVAPFQPLTREDVARVLQVSVRCIHDWVGRGVLPAPKPIEGVVRWHPDIFYGWLDQLLKDGGGLDAGVARSLELGVVEAVPTQPAEMQDAQGATITAPPRTSGTPPESGATRRAGTKSIAVRDRAALQRILGGHPES